MGETERLPASAVLMAISKHIAIRCRDQNKAFMDCKKLDRNPEKCLKEGDAVTGCAIGILKDLNQKCPEQLKTFHECMDYFRWHLFVGKDEIYECKLREGPITLLKKSENKY